MDIFEELSCVEREVAWRQFHKSILNICSSLYLFSALVYAISQLFDLTAAYVVLVSSTNRVRNTILHTNFAAINLIPFWIYWKKTYT